MAFHHAHAPYKVQVIDRVLALLEILAAYGPAMTLAELALALSCRRAPRSDCLPSCSSSLRRARIQHRRLCLALSCWSLAARQRTVRFRRSRTAVPRPPDVFDGRVRVSLGPRWCRSARDRARRIRTHCTRPLTAGLRTPAYCTANGKRFSLYPASDLIARIGRRRCARTRRTL